jgi:hypothetical protein
MKTIELRYKRFLKVAFFTDEVHTLQKDKLDKIAKREFKGDKIPSEKTLQILENVGCSRAWLLYGNGEMCDDSPAGHALRRHYLRDFSSFIKLFNRTAKYKTISEIQIPDEIRD